MDISGTWYVEQRWQGKNLFPLISLTLEKDYKALSYPFGGTYITTEDGSYLAIALTYRGLDTITYIGNFVDPSNIQGSMRGIRRDGSVAQGTWSANRSLREEYSEADIKEMGLPGE